MKSIKKRLKNILNNFKSTIKISFSKNLWLSLGENCLTDNILSRHHLKSFSTPYSHSRSNLDYAITLEKTNYSNLMDLQYLKYDLIDDKKVVRSTIINNSDQMYNELHMNGFEFTHHDVKSSNTERKSLERKINRMHMIRGRKNVIFLYHYRVNENMCLSEIFKKAETFSEFYAIENKKCSIVIFTQKIIGEDSARKVTYRKENNILFFELFTRYSWSGDDDNIFWAKNDDDLIEKMLNAVKTDVLGKTSISQGSL